MLSIRYVNTKYNTARNAVRGQRYGRWINLCGKPRANRTGIRSVDDLDFAFRRLHADCSTITIAECIVLRTGHTVAGAAIAARTL